MLSIIIPTLNEKENLDNIINISKSFNNSEVIIVDGGSKDYELQVLKNHNLNVFSSRPNRGEQLALGAKKSKGEWLLFLHADTTIYQKNIKEIYNFARKENAKKVAYFKLNFDDRNLLSLIIHKWANLRTKFFRLPFGDQALLIERMNYFFIGGHKDLKIMEDMDLILRVPFSKRTLFNSAITSSFRKYKKNGILIQSTKHIICQILFLLRVKNEMIYRFYKN